MPKDVIYTFPMPSYGNIATCEAQGLIFMMGNGLAFCMNGILNIYYLCTLRYNLAEKTFRCYLEIPLFILSLVISITIPSVTLVKEELLNPSPTTPFCVPTTYPLDCTKADNPECRGEGMHGGFAPLFIFTITLGFFTLMITMALIVHSFYRNARSLRKALKNKPSQEIDAKYAALQYAQESSGIITRQALMYIAAFLITWVFGFVNFVLRDSSGSDNKELLSVLRMIFQPLQGFFNLIIFAYHKVYIVLLSDEHVTFAEAVSIVVLHPDKMKELVFTLDLDLEDDGIISICAHQNNHDAENDRSQVLSGFEGVFRDAGAGAEIEFDKPSMADKSPVFISSEGLSSIDEERNITYEHYDNVGQILEDLPFQNFDDIPGLKKRSVMESKDDGDGDISMNWKETNDDGISFPSTSSINTPSDVKKEAIKDNNATNLSYPVGQSTLSRRVMVEKRDYAESEKQKHNLSAQPLSHPHATPAVDSWLETNVNGGQSPRHDMIARDGGINNLSGDNEWSLDEAESFAEDSADLRYAQMKEIIAAKSLAASAELSKSNDGTRWRSWFIGDRKKQRSRM